MRNTRKEVYETISIIFKKLDSEKVWKTWCVVIISSLFLDSVFFNIF